MTGEGPSASLQHDHRSAPPENRTTPVDTGVVGRPGGGLILSDPAQPHYILTESGVGYRLRTAD